MPVAKKLQVKDMERIAGNLHTSVFNPSTCCLWCAYVSNLRRPHKGVSVQFFFNGKKQSLHRLLFINYVSSSLNHNSYLKRKCPNCSCVNVNHYYSVPYLKERKDPAKLGTEERSLTVAPRFTELKHNPTHLVSFF